MKTNPGTKSGTSVVDVPESVLSEMSEVAVEAAVGRYWEPLIPLADGREARSVFG